MKHDHCKQDLFYKPPNVIYDHIQWAVQHKQNSMHAFTIMRFQKGKQVNGKGKKLWAVLGSTAGDKTVMLAAQNNEYNNNKQQHSLFSQASWGRLEMKPERNKLWTLYYII